MWVFIFQISWIEPFQNGDLKNFLWKSFIIFILLKKVNENLYNFICWMKISTTTVFEALKNPLNNSIFLIYWLHHLKFPSPTAWGLNTNSGNDLAKHFLEKFQLFWENQFLLLIFHIYHYSYYMKHLTIAKNVIIRLN